MSVLSTEDAAALTALLHQAQGGDLRAAQRLLAVVHDQLRRIAHDRMRGQAADHTLQTTALVDEAYLRLFGGDGASWKDRDHFLAVASSAMRSVLVDHARAKRRDKRRPPGERVPLDAVVESYEQAAIDLIALDEAMERLAAVDPDLVKLVELRFYLGLTVDEVARVSETPKRTVERELATARAWLRKEIG